MNGAPPRHVQCFAWIWKHRSDRWHRHCLETWSLKCLPYLCGTAVNRYLWHVVWWLSSVSYHVTNYCYFKLLWNTSENFITWHSSSGQLLLKYQWHVCVCAAVWKFSHTHTQNYHSNYSWLRSAKHINLLSKCKLATTRSFDLQSHHQATLNRISVDALSGTARVWDHKMFTE